MLAEAPEGDVASAAEDVEKPGPSKSERTRAAIVDAALQLFTEQGFDATTMRQIATAAGVSVGNAYYYFAGKEQLVVAIYERFFGATNGVMLEALAGETLLAPRIERCVLAWMKTMRPHRHFAEVIFRDVADPSSPMSPLSDESAPMREGSYDVWRELLRGAADANVAPEHEDIVVRLLWGYSMLMVVAWTQDASADGRRSKRVVQRSAPMVGRLIQLSSLPMFASTVDDFGALLADIAKLKS